MTNLELLRGFVANIPMIDELTANVHIDWTAGDQKNYGIMPTGTTYTVKKSYINGDKLVIVQEDYSLFIDDCTADDVERLERSNFTFRLMDYIQEKSYNESLPFTEQNQFLNAQNGSLFQIEEDGQYGKYLIQLNLTYEKEYKR